MRGHLAAHDFFLFVPHRETKVPLRISASFRLHAFVLTYGKLDMTYVHPNCDGDSSWKTL
jgi:hypothetical protein